MAKKSVTKKSPNATRGGRRRRSLTGAVTTVVIDVLQRQEFSPHPGGPVYYTYIVCVRAKVVLPCTGGMVKSIAAKLTKGSFFLAGPVVMTPTGTSYWYATTPITIPGCSPGDTISAQVEVAWCCPGKDSMSVPKTLT